MSSNIATFIASLPLIEDPVKAILSSYDVATSPQVNIQKLLENNQKPELEQCATYIRTLKEQYPTIVQRLEPRKGKNKPDYAGDISIFINGVIQLDCEVCENKYCHSLAENTLNNNLTCFICNRYSHLSCYEELGELKPGICFICSICKKTSTPNAGSDSTTKTPKTVVIEKETAAVSGITADDTLLEVVEDDNSETLCPLLAVGECPHGISGKGCSYKHPKWCWKYQRHGDRPEGCRRRDKCWYYHPKLCENSLKLNACLNSKCKEHHLEGTRRHQPRNQHPNAFNQPGNSFNHPGNSFNQPSDQQRQPVKSFNIQSESDFPPVGQQSRNKQLNPWKEEQSSSAVSSDQKMEDFLDKYTAKMSSQFASTISTQVNMAVQQSISPLREKINLLGGSQTREQTLQREGGLLINKETEGVQNQDLQSLLLKYLQNLIPQKSQTV